MAEIKVLPGTTPKTVEDRIRAIFERHPEVLQEESNQLIILSFNKDRIEPLADPEISFVELDNLLHEAKQAFFANGIVRLLKHLIDTKQ